MIKFLLWLILFVLCWPIAVLALIAYPIVWVVLLPFRLVGVAVGGVLQVLWTLITLPLFSLMTPETTADPRIAIQKSLTLGSFRSRGRSLSDALAHSLTRLRRARAVRLDSD